MTISACLIIRNEESEIYECLTSLIGVDEIVILDTGSTDHTPGEVARWRSDYPDTPVHYHWGEYVWQDDFAHARNAAADLCSGDWLLAISADGRMAEGAVSALRQALATAQGRTMALRQVARGSGQSHRRVLAWRRDSDVRWSGAIHENLSADDGETAPDCDMIYGWSASHHHDPDRNLRILQKELDRDPDNARHCYYLAAEYRDRRRYEEAAPWYERAAALSNWLPEKADALLCLARIRWHQSRGEEARLLCLRSLACAPDCKEALRLMAEMSWPEQADVWRRYAEHARNTGVIFVRVK